MSKAMPITHINVDDLERGLRLSVDIAPAFREQAEQWLDARPAPIMEAGVRERLQTLVKPPTMSRLLPHLLG